MSGIITGITIADIDMGGSAVLVTVDFGAATAVSVVEVSNALLSGAPVSDCLKAQHSPDGVTWTDFGVATLGGGARTRRFAAPPSAPVSRRYWRLILDSMASLDERSLSIDAVAFRSESATLSPARVLPHLVGDAAAYAHILSDQTSDIYSAGVRVGAAASPFPEGVLANIDYTHDDDLILMFHEQVPVWRFFRQGADDEWDSRAQVFTNIPNYQFPDTTYSNGVDEVQQVTFVDFAAGETFNLQLDGELTSSIVYSATPATTAANIKAALEALDVMGEGTVTVAQTSTDVFSVTFEGEAGQFNWTEMAASAVTSVTGSVTTATLTEGEEGGEPIVSAARGYWRTGDFEVERLVLGGPKSAKKILNASVLTDYFNLSAPGRRATDGVMLAISAGNIRQVAAEKFLHVFTEACALSLRAPALSGNEANPIKPDDDTGVQDRLRPVVVDGATMIVQSGGRAVVEFIYSNEGQGHIANPVSVRAPELVVQPVDMFVRRAGYGFESDALFLPLNAGGLVMFQSQRAIGFRPFTRYTTPAGGKFLAGGAEERGPTYVVVERTINGVTKRLVEGFDINRLLDCSILVTIVSDAATLAVPHLEGEEVWAIGDNGYWYGPATVEGGVIARPDGEDFAAGQYQVGLFFDAWAIPMPVRFDTQGGSIADRKKRVAEAGVSLLASAPPEIVYMGAARDFPGQRFAEDILDSPPMERLITGRLSIDRLRGWAVDPVVMYRRKWPGPLHIRSITLAVNWTP